MAEPLLGRSPKGRSSQFLPLTFIGTATGATAVGLLPRFLQPLSRLDLFERSQRLRRPPADEKSAADHDIVSPINCMRMSAYCANWGTRIVSFVAQYIFKLWRTLGCSPSMNVLLICCSEQKFPNQKFLSFMAWTNCTVLCSGRVLNNSISKGAFAKTSSVAYESSE